ncbi:YolD-like family protein [Bacillus horti]|uniref:YolD-like family protein n=1 Tax=Caldalkalibacillus horti TaxID=77523 RepID=A0ABT9W578_9BACI|nr:YolD-like family protein [Bacillus horti]MDQ0168227.1 hypothetical protein [Bacillus horti]
MKENKLTPGSNIMWEASRMMLPEHRELIIQKRKEQNRKDRPIFDEQTLEYFSHLMSEASNKDQEITITIFDPYQETKIKGKLKKIDLQLRQVKMETDNDFVWIKLEDILHIDYF